MRLRLRRACSVTLVLIGSLGVFIARAHATANFARKYNADCTLCHTMYPQLNAFGYKFRQLGYRMPGEVTERIKAQPVASHAQVAPQPLSGPAAAGKALYQQHNCSICHSVGGAGGKLGPALDEVGTRRTAPWLKDHFVNPPAVVLGTPMPALKVAPEELDGMVAYMLSLTKPATKAEEVVRQPWKFDFAEGASFRFRPRLNVQKRPGDVTRTDFNATDVTFFYNGPATNHLSYFFETNLLEEGGPSGLEVGSLQYNFGGDDVFGFTRFGQFHVIGRVGQGILDRPVTISTPLLLGTRVNGLRFSTNGRGAESALSFKGTTIRAFYLNSLAFAAEDRELPANAEDPLGLDRQNQSRSPSFAAVVEKVFPGTISGFTAAYLHFRGPSVPGRRGRFVGDTSVPALGTNDRTIDRLVLGANYLRPGKNGLNFHFLAGGGLGFDTRISGDSLVTANPSLLGQRQRSYGFFAEFDKYFGTNIVAAGRFDYFRPDTLGVRNITRQCVIALIANFENHMRLAGEYRLIRLYPTATTTSLKTDNRFQSEFQFNF